jgi:hypothetical protein
VRRRIDTLSGIVTWPVLLALCLASDLYEDKVRPLLASKCLACHAESKAGGLRLDSRAAMLAGGKSGTAALVPGKPDESLLVQAIEFRHARLRMPPAGKLSTSEIAAVREWIANGAVVPAAGPSTWALQPLSKPALQGVDANIRAMLQAKGLTPNPAADRRTLRRRLYFDLAGLPAPAEDHGEPIGKLVDGLLSSRQFGERWARHWLDVARYGEDDYTGTQPKEYPNAFRYRDWVIDAVNRDMPYDLFLQAQIAGDVLPAQRGFIDRDYTGGLGLFGLGPWYYGISQPPQARADERHDRVDMIGRGVLGLTIACARCHDHKYDPITMQDYYGLAGVFASAAYKEYPLADAETVAAWDARQKQIKEIEKSLGTFLEQQTVQLAEILSRQTSRYLLAAAGIESEGAGLDAELLKRFREYLQKPDPQHAYLNRWRELAERKASEAELRAAAAEFQSALLAVVAEKRQIDEENRENVLKAKFAAASSGVKRRHIVLPFGYQSDEDFNPGADVPSKSLPREKFQLWRRFFNMKNVMLRFEGEALERFLSSEWKKHVESLRAEKKRLEDLNGKQYPFLHGMGEGEAWDLNLNLRGNPEALGEVVPRRLPRLLEAGLGRTGPFLLDQGSGRLQLAQAVSTHPLAARVAVNRVWLHLFGSGLVRTPSNFGKVGDTPGNPQLLEYLAWRFRESGYSMKSLIREIVLSATYQASAAASEASEKIDGENRYFWKMNRRRLDAEAFRDSLLAVAGTLDLEGFGKPSLSVTDPTNARRTVYARMGRFRQDETLSLFDFPSASVTCEQRVSTNVPLQKLYVLNSEFVKGQATALAARAGRDVEALYRFALGRKPTSKEAALASEFVAGAEGEDAKWVQLAQVLLSSNEFAFVD